MVKFFEKLWSPLPLEEEKPPERSRSLAVLERQQPGEGKPNSDELQVGVPVRLKSGARVIINPWDLVRTRDIMLDGMGSSGAPGTDARQVHTTTTHADGRTYHQTDDHSQHDHSQHTTNNTISVDRRVFNVSVDRRTIVVPSRPTIQGDGIRPPAQLPPPLPPPPPEPPKPPVTMKPPRPPKKPRVRSGSGFTIPPIWWLISCLMLAGGMAVYGIWMGQYLFPDQIMWLLVGIGAALGILYMIPKQIFRTPFEQSIAGMLAILVIALILVWLISTRG